MSKKWRDCTRLLATHRFMYRSDILYIEKYLLIGIEFYCAFLSQYTRMNYVQNIECTWTIILFQLVLLSVAYSGSLKPHITATNSFINSDNRQLYTGAKSKSGLQFVFYVTRLRLEGYLKNLRYKSTRPLVYSQTSWCSCSILTLKSGRKNTKTLYWLV